MIIVLTSSKAAIFMLPADMIIVPLGSGGRILDLDWFLSYQYTKLVLQMSEIVGKGDMLAFGKH
jgi:hypothetical protein